MPFDANGNWVSESPLYSGGFSQPYQFGSTGNYMGYSSQPMSFANTGTVAAAPVAGVPPVAPVAPTQPYSQQFAFNPQYSANPNSMSQQAFSSATPASPDVAPVAGTQPPAASNSFNPIGFGLGAIQTGVGLYQLNKLSKTPQPEYKASAGTLAANQRAQQNSQMGYSPSQAAAFKANMGTALNTQFANQRNLAGGNLAGALGARGTAQKLQAMNQFAVGDADRQMQNIRYADEQTSKLQNLQNMNTEAAMRRRMMTEQALGAAVQQGTVNMAGSFDTGSSFASFAKMFGGGTG
jgi:hypothetical protein